MIDVIIKGFFLGLVLSVMVGPVFFVLIETSITKGARKALMLDAGVLASDLFYIFIAYKFFEEVAELTGANDEYFKAIGGCLFIAFGILSLFKGNQYSKSSQEKGQKVKVQARAWVKLFFKGFLLNAINPGVLFYWFTIISVGADKSAAVTSDYGLFFYISTILITFFSIDVLKIFGAKQLKNILTPSWMRFINKFTGIILIIFGILFIIDGIFEIIPS